MTPCRPRRASQGYALVELILTLGIGAVIAAAVWSVYAERRVLIRGTEHAQAIKLLQAKADEAYALSIEFESDDGSGTGTTEALTLARLANASNGELPREVIPSGTLYTHYWGGTWAMSAESASGGAYMDLQVLEMTAVPQGECRIILQQVAPLMYDTHVNGDLVGLELAPGSTIARNSLNYAQSMPLCVATNTMRFRKLKELNVSDLRRSQPVYGPLTPEERGEVDGGRHYQEAFLPHYDRMQAAMAARETAQQALD